MTDQSRESIEKSLREFAEKNNYTLPPEHFGGVVTGLLHNKEKHGEYYCPCRNVEVAMQKPKYLASIKCPCQFVHADIKRTGHCHCLLFWKKAK